jgi:hypothetical protein
MIKVVSMGFSRKRIGRDGKPRYTFYYLGIRSQERSAGTFSSKKDANGAWKKAVGAVSAGKPGDPSRGRQTFKVYVLEKRLPHHLLEPGAVPGQGLPERQGIPAVQAQPADHCENPGPRHRQRAP